MAWRLLRIIPLVAIAGICATAAGCAGNRQGVSSALSQFVAAERADSAVRAFYSSRTGEPVWVDGKEPTSAATVALGAFARAGEHGFDPERYAATTLKARTQKLRSSGPNGAAPADLAKLDFDLTKSLLALGRDVSAGRPGVAARLAAVIDEGDFSAWPDDVRPAHPQYAALQRVLGGMLARGPAADQKQVHRIRLSMDRWRKLPDPGPRYVLVNIPQFHLFVFENGRQVFDSKVIVGKPGDETPVFSADMTHVVLSPYWNIPESIAEGETVPSIVRNPAYLTRNGIEVLRRTENGAERVDPASVDWNNPSETSTLSLRQRPGPGNALGHIKFLLPNRYSVYLHDTPGDNLFARAGRAFSHGCVRVEQPVGLAQYLLADQPQWTEDAIKKAMVSGVEKSVKLTSPLPVHIVYVTAWVDDAGTPQFLGDVYKRDR